MAKTAIFRGAVCFAVSIAAVTPSLAGGLERGGQGPDHPVHLAIAETRYIKSLTCRILPNS
mgnify:CR=1 FL=1